jgi:hypothetical protein
MGEGRREDPRENCRNFFLLACFGGWALGMSPERSGMMEGATASTCRTQAAKPWRRLRREPTTCRASGRMALAYRPKRRYESTFWRRALHLCGCTPRPPCRDLTEQQEARDLQHLQHAREVGSELSGEHQLDSHMHGSTTLFSLIQERTNGCRPERSRERQFWRGQVPRRSTLAVIAGLLSAGLALPYVCALTARDINILHSGFDGRHRYRLRQQKKKRQ